MLQYFNIYKDRIFIKNKDIELTYDESLAIILKFSKLIDQQTTTKNLIFLLPNCLEAQLLLLAAIQVRDVILINPKLLEIIPSIHTRFCDSTIITFEKNTQYKNSLIIDKDIIAIVPTTIMSSNISTAGSLTLLTSGTTGEVKSIKIQANEILNYGNRLLSYLEFDTTDRILNFLPFYHGFGLTRILTTIVTGSSQFLPESNFVKDITKLINDTNSTWTSLIPHQVTTMMQHSTQLHNKFKFVTTSADVCSADIFDKFNSRYLRGLLSEYGCTEASIISSCTPNQNCFGSVGIPDSNTVELIDDEIYVKPLWKTDKQLIATGDIGYIDNDGFLWLKGRKKEIIKRNGQTIFPVELENYLRKIPGILNVAVYADDRDLRGDRIGIIYTGLISVDKVHLWLKQHLKSKYRYFSNITQVDTIPLVANKIKRLTLKDYVTTIK